MVGKSSCRLSSVRPCRCVVLQSTDPQSVQQHFTFTLWWQKLPCWCDLLIILCDCCFMLKTVRELYGFKEEEAAVRLCASWPAHRSGQGCRAAPRRTASREAARVAASLWQRNNNDISCSVDNMAEPRMERGGHTPKRVFINNTDSYASQHIAKVKIRQGSCGSEPSVGRVVART